MASKILERSINEFFEVQQLSDQTILKPNRKVKMKILDEGLMQTAICRSNIGRIDEKELKLEYRGHNVRDLANNYSFNDVVYLLMTGKLNAEGSEEFLDMFHNNYLSALKHIEKLTPVIFGTTPTDFLAIAVLSSQSKWLFGRFVREEDERLIITASILAVIAAAIAIYVQKYATSEPVFKTFFDTKRSFFANFLATCFGQPCDDVAEEMLNKFLILHAEHGLNCSTATVRAVASSGADPFNAVAAGICAFSGPLHGGASEEVGLMIDDMHDNSKNISTFIDELVETKQRLMGFGHRIYKQPDPRASYMSDILAKQKAKFDVISSYVNISQELASEVSKRPYFSQRGLYPNPDLFNGLLLRRAGFKSHMNTALLCFSRAAGWLAHYYDSIDSKAPILRPQELYL
ncbi:citrate/2-methylcitrate synthase [Photorhabdus tasmaniensis]|uniref:Citrate synthase n=1 Tax=Photorhabdus tasmaniensis TaxID=1004159 RepID=A0ABX0GC27_9GAMM|nr:citrate/2-methylcitrate synthase [Photorhabdus tasmaniensis]NHB86537.1 hypothetical protein [Photorhabdus tasmaniensis]